MRALLVTDVHGAADELAAIVGTAAWDAVLCAGDLSDAIWYPDAYGDVLAGVLDALTAADAPVGAVPGNVDRPGECLAALERRGANLHDEVASFPAFDAVGYGGGVAVSAMPFEPSGDEIAAAVRALAGQTTADVRVAVVHQPPAGTRVDVTDDGEHVGSRAVRAAVEETGFDLAVTGHIHESRGVDDLDGTTVVNPGAVLDGHYAVAEFGDDVEVWLASL